MITYPELAAAVVELHNEIKGLFVSPNVAHIYLRPEMEWKDQFATAMEAIDSLRKIILDMKSDAVERMSVASCHRREALELADAVVTMHTLLVLSRANKRNDERETMRLHDMYMDALRVAAYGYDEVQTPVVYEQEMPF